MRPPPCGCGSRSVQPGVSPASVEESLRLIDEQQVRDRQDRDEGVHPDPGAAEVGESATGLTGTSAATSTTSATLAARARPGRLCVNGVRWVRTTKMTAAWVTSDSTNQPDWNRARPGVEDAREHAEGEEVEERSSTARRRT